MTRTFVIVTALTLALGSLVAGARADCPAAAPTAGSACVDPGVGGCPYERNGVMVLCSCRDGHWACEPMPTPRS